MTNLTSLSLTGIEIKLITFFIGNITGKFGIREISRKIKIDYKLVHTAVQKLVKKDVLIKQRQANLDLCRLNFSVDPHYVLYCEMLKTKAFLGQHKDLREFFGNLHDNVKNIYYTLAIFGSFAKGHENKNSDLDLLIIAGNKETAEDINRTINSESIILKRKIHIIAISEDDFIKNLGDKKLNVIAECFKSHIIITGAEAFYNGARKVFGEN